MYFRQLSLILFCLLFVSLQGISITNLLNVPINIQHGRKTVTILNNQTWKNEHLGVVSVIVNQDDGFFSKIIYDADYSSQYFIAHGNRDRILFGKILTLN